MENIIDLDNFANELNELSDPNKKTWYNEAVLRQVFMTLIYCEIAIVGFCIQVPLGFSVDTFLLGQKIVIIPILVVGFKAAANEKAFKTRKTLEIKADGIKNENNMLRQEINKLDKENYKLKIELDNKCKLLESLKEARFHAESLEADLK